MLTSPVTSVKIPDINPHNLKSLYLRGLVHLFVDRPIHEGDKPTPWPDEVFWWAISKGIERIEEGANVSVMPRKRTEFHDYILGDYIQFAFVKLWFPPVHAVTKVSAIYPVTGSPSGLEFNAETENTIFDFPPEWFRLYPSGQLHIVPTQGTLSQVLLGRGGSYLPMIYGTLTYLPQLWRVEYIGGFHNTDVPFIVADAIFKAAAVQLLTTLSDTLRPPGVTSMATNFDGLSRSYSFENGGGRNAALFSSRISAYNTELYGSPEDSGTHQTGGMIKTIRDRYMGINMAVA